MRIDPHTAHGGGSRWLTTLSLLLAASVVSPAAAGQREEWRERMMPLVPRGYVCQETATPIVIDGNLADAAWASAPWTEDFLDIQGARQPKPQYRTRAKLLWDRDYLYVAAELEEPHVWATLKQHDSVIFQDPDFEVFIDPDGDTHNYYEFEINALNTGWDLFLPKPYQDQGSARNQWEIPGLKTGVQVQGTLNDPSGKDKGWTVEIAFPWKVLGEHARHAGPPEEGEQWRIGFSRVEWKIEIEGNRYRKTPNTPEDNWIWSPQGVIDMHRPEMWGLLQFTRRTGPDLPTVTPLPGKPARDLALEVYYAQRDFRAAHQRWAANLGELGLDKPQLPPGVKALVLKFSDDGYTCVVSFGNDDKPRAWRIREDRLLTLE